MRIKGKDGVWERESSLSEVAKLMVQKGNEDGKVGNCLVCDSLDVKRQGVCLTLYTTVRPDGQEARGSMSVCRAHRAQWYWYPALHAVDGQHR